MFKKYPAQHTEAKNEAWRCELGHNDFPAGEVDRRIKSALGGKKSWVLIGGPPCQAFSMAGRSRVGGINKKDHRVYLYREYLRIIAVHQPTVFVMENVSGLLSAKLNGDSIFQMILNDLGDPGKIFTGTGSKLYRIYSFVKKPNNSLVEENPKYDSFKDYLIKAENYGIPQMRHRVILFGIREDKNEFHPPVLNESNKQINLDDVIGNLPGIRSGVSRRIIETSIKNGRKRHIYEKIKDSAEVWMDTINRFREELGLETKKQNYYSERGALYTECQQNLKVKTLHDWFIDPFLNGICNHESRNHLESDLKRYLFASDYLKRRNSFPRMKDYPEDLLPEHRSATSGKFTDRFRVQPPDRPATTITSHISKDGHYFIHYDPDQCRSLTVREAARIQTFPDNYYFWGTRTQQYHQVGNAVPPILARQLAEIVYKIIKK